MGMNEHVRAVVKKAVEELPISQAELARQLDLAPKVLNRALNQQGKTPEVWDALLDALGLELTVIRKQSPSPHGQKASVNADALRQAVETLAPMIFTTLSGERLPALESQVARDEGGGERRLIGWLKFVPDEQTGRAEAEGVYRAVLTSIHGAYELNLAINGEPKLPGGQDA